MTNLLVLTADKDALLLIKSFLKRLASKRSFSYDVISHPKHDAGVFKNAAEYLRPHISNTNFLFTIFDYEGCGCDEPTQNIESIVRDNLNCNGWNGKNECLVIKPEIDLWLWGHEIYLKKLCSWNHSQSIYDFLRENNFNFNNQNKPARPKEAFEFLIGKQKIPRSSSLYGEIARITSYRHCREESFVRFYTKVTEVVNNL